MLCAVAALACAPAPAAEFGVMETATTVAARTFKFDAYPIFAQPQPTQEQNMGVSVGAGYGLMRQWDLELRFANFDDASFAGLDVEHLFFDGMAWDASMAAGGHVARTDFGDQAGADFSAILTYTVPSLPRLNFNAALDYAYDELDRTGGAVRRGMDRSFSTLHFVPAVQYRVRPRVDLIGEYGIGLDGDTREYAALGLSTYFE